MTGQMKNLDRNYEQISTEKYMYDNEYWGKN